MFCCRGSQTSDNDPRSPRSRGRSKRMEKNPYSNQGREKFAKVLADLEARRKEIMAQMGEQDICIIRFVYSSHGWVPIVAKIKNQKEVKIDATGPTSLPIQQNSVEEIVPSSGSMAAVKDAAKLDAKMKKSFSGSLNKNETALRRPCYWPVVVSMILLCLMVFGRSFAIICTAIWWYLMPILKGEDVHMRRSMKKDNERRLSDKK
ncbi:hypothetical protein AAC387_Pa02g3158 [Persea americana]